MWTYRRKRWRKKTHGNLFTANEYCFCLELHAVRMSASLLHCVKACSILSLNPLEEESVKNDQAFWKHGLACGCAGLKSLRQQHYRADLIRRRAPTPGGHSGFLEATVPAPNGILISASLLAIRVAAEDATCHICNFIKCVHYITLSLY